ncbi:MAG: hypothetical protein WC520_01550 [Candidatus Paceibacterota bacterium]
MGEKKVIVPDPILAEPKNKKMPWKKKAVIFFIVGLVGGWLWMTWATQINQPLGLEGQNFWQLLLPF